MVLKKSYRYCDVNALVHVDIYLGVVWRRDEKGKPRPHIILFRLNGNEF